MQERVSNIAKKIDIIANFLIVAIIILVVIGSIAAVFFYRYYKMKRREKLSDLSVDYSQLKRNNALDYLKFEDIRDGMIVSENGTLFTAVISCRGFEYESAHVAERVGCQNGYRGFINTIDIPITYRQYCTDVNLSGTCEMYKAAYEEVEEKLFFLNEDFESAKKTMETMERQYGEGAIKNPDYIQIVDVLEDMRKQLENLKWRRFHLLDQLEYAKQLQGRKSDPTFHETYIVDWKYVASNFPVDLSTEEIYARAIDELYSLTTTKIKALSGAGVRARRCSTKELIEMCRRHFNPVSSNYDHLDEEEKKSFFNEIVTTSKKDDLVKEQHESMVLDLMEAASNMAMEITGNIEKGTGNEKHVKSGHMPKRKHKQEAVKNKEAAVRENEQGGMKS